MAKKTVAELLAAGKKNQKKRSKLPTDKEIIDETVDIIERIVTSPGPPVTISDRSPVYEFLFGSETASMPDGRIPLIPTIPPGTVVPQAVRDWISEEFQFPGPSPRPRPIKPIKPKPIRTDPQLINDEILRIELQNANGRARKRNGQFKKGWDQRRVMKMAQKECTKERERLGLCKRKSTRKGQRRKTARRAYKR